jgi:hypothetical protein
VADLDIRYNDDTHEGLRGVNWEMNIHGTQLVTWKTRTKPGTGRYGGTPSRPEKYDQQFFPLSNIKKWRILDA